MQYCVNINQYLWPDSEVHQVGFQLDGDVGPGAILHLGDVHEVGPVLLRQPVAVLHQPLAHPGAVVDRDHALQQLQTLLHQGGRVAQEYKPITIIEVSTFSI